MLCFVWFTEWFFIHFIKHFIYKFPFFNLDFQWRQQSCTEYSLSSDPSFCYDLFCGVKKVWLTCWSAVYTGIRRLTKCLDNLLKSSVQCKPSAFLFVLIPFVVWSSYSQLCEFACLKDFRKIILCECVFWTHWGANSLSLQRFAALWWWSTKADKEC